MRTVASDLFCLNCGYNQRGGVADRCPECGQSHADSPPSPVRIPWAHRAHLGWFRAYWRTVFLACFRPGRILEEIEHRVTLADAHAFRRTTVLHVLVPLALFVAATYLDVFGPEWEGTRRAWFDTTYAPLWPVVPILVGLWGFMHVAFSIPGEFARPSRTDAELNRRAIALSYYACAPVAFVALATPLMLVRPMLIFQAAGNSWFVSWPLTLTLAMIGVLWWWRSVTMPAATAGRPFRRCVVVAIVLPIIWLVVGFVMVILVPIALYLTAAGFRSIFSGWAAS